MKNHKKLYGNGLSGIFPKISFIYIIQDSVKQQKSYFLDGIFFLSYHFSFFLSNKQTKNITIQVIFIDNNDDDTNKDNDDDDVFLIKLLLLLLNQ